MLSSARGSQLYLKKLQSSVGELSVFHIISILISTFVQRNDDARKPAM